MADFHSAFAKKVALALRDREDKESTTSSAVAIDDVYESLCYDDPYVATGDITALARTSTFPGLSTRFVAGVLAVTRSSETAAAGSELATRIFLVLPEALLSTSRSSFLLVKVCVFLGSYEKDSTLSLDAIESALLSAPPPPRAPSPPHPPPTASTFNEDGDDDASTSSSLHEVFAAESDDDDFVFEVDSSVPPQPSSSLSSFLEGCSPDPCLDHGWDAVVVRTIKLLSTFSPALLSSLPPERWQDLNLAASISSLASTLFTSGVFGEERGR